MVWNTKMPLVFLKASDSDTHAVCDRDVNTEANL